MNLIILSLTGHYARLGHLKFLVNGFKTSVNDAPLIHKITRNIFLQKLPEFYSPKVGSFYIVKKTICEWNSGNFWRKIFLVILWIRDIMEHQLRPPEGTLVWEQSEKLIMTIFKLIPTLYLFEIFPNQSIFCRYRNY